MMAAAMRRALELKATNFSFMEGKQAMSRGRVLGVQTVQVGIVLSLVMAITAPATALDMVWMRHEPGDNALDQYGHDGGPAIPEVDSNLNGRGVVILGNNIFLDVVPLASGGYVYARDDINVNNNDHLFDSFVHDADMNEIADSDGTRGINGNSYRGMVGLSNGDYAWARAVPDMQFFVHSGTTAAEIAASPTGRGPGTYAGIVPVANGNFVWGRFDPGPNEVQFFLHSGTTALEIDDNLADPNRRGGGAGVLGMAGLANGNFAYGRNVGGSTDWFINDGTTADELAAATNLEGVGDGGPLAVLPLADGNFVYIRSHQGAYDLHLHSGTTAAWIAGVNGVRGIGVWLGAAALPDGSFVVARADGDMLDLFQYDGTTLAEIGINWHLRGVGAGGSLFDGMTGLVPEPATLLVLGPCGLWALLRRKAK